MNSLIRSNCARCFRPGHLSIDQLLHNSRGHGNEPLKGLRFHCDRGHVWIITREEGEAHTRFLERAGL